MTAASLVVIGFDLLSLAQSLVLLYFSALIAGSFLLCFLGLRSIREATIQPDRLPLVDLVEQQTFLPVSILVPAHDEATSIVESVRSFLRLDYPVFEVIVVSDGSTDGTVERLAEAFSLVECERVYPVGLPAEPIRSLMRSTTHPNLFVAEKAQGGKSDALNAGLNLARYPLVCTVDADSMLAPDALLRGSRLFLDDPSIVAVGGSIRPINGSRVVAGRVVELQLPKRWIERIQVVEYARSFFSGRLGWGRFNALPLVSGAFGLFRRNTLLEAGGYRRGIVGEDLEIVLRLHKLHRQARKPCTIVSLPEPACWTQVPADLQSLRRQRNRWQRGLWEALWIHRDLLFRPRQGRLGFVTLPWLWIFEAIAPVLELAAYCLLPLTLLGGVLGAEFALLFGLLALTTGVLLSMVAIGVETLLLQRYGTLRERLLLVVAALFELVGYRQIIVAERFLASFQVWSKRGRWGKAARVGWDGASPVEASGGRDELRKAG